MNISRCSVITRASPLLSRSLSVNRTDYYMDLLLHCTFTSCYSQLHYQLLSKVACFLPIFLPSFVGTIVSNADMTLLSDESSQLSHQVVVFTITVASTFLTKLCERKGNYE